MDRSPLVAVAGCVLAIVLLASCGTAADDGSEPVEGPLPTGTDDPRAYTERFMSRNPLALARLEHLVVVHLEPTSAEEHDTCPETDGVDCLAFFVEKPTRVELSIADDVETLGELVLLDAADAVVLRHAHGLEPSAALVTPGSYRLELHHAFAGDPAAPEQMVFLRPETSDETDSAVGDVLAEQVGAGATAPVSPPAARLTAQQNCVRCNFTAAGLEEENFDGLDLSGSIFNNAKVRRTSFRRATMNGCQFLSLFSLYVGSDLRAPAANAPWDTSEIDADFSDAMLSRTMWAPSAVFVVRSHFAGVFRGAKLDGSVWKGRRTSAQDPNTYVLNADFRNADLTDSRWEEELTLVRPAAASRMPKCTFQGADLTRAKFTGKIRENLSLCRFDKDPESGHATILRGTDLTRANLAGAAMSDADLSNAILDHTIMEGTDLTRAILFGATISGVRWRGTIFTNAMIRGIVPASLNEMDLVGTNFSGVDFAGLDLTRTDLSKAVLDPAPRFAGAKLSDGTRGVNLAGHRFADAFAQFKGAELTGVDFSHARLFQANLEGATLNNAKLIGANLNFAALRGAKLRGATLGIQPGTEGAAASLRGAFMTDVDLSDADLRSVDLTEAHLYGATGQSNLLRTRLDSADLSGAVCAGARFSGTLNNTVLNGAQLVNAVFNGATLAGAKFDNAYLQGADFSNAVSVTGASLSNAAISAQPGSWNFMEQDGTPFIFRFEATKLGALATSAMVTCPNGDSGPCCPEGNLQSCLGAKLKPVRNGPNPPVPSCVPSGQYCYENCLDPPNFDHRPPCR